MYKHFEFLILENKCSTAIKNTINYNKKRSLRYV